ncbi:MAG: APC family permease [Allosphingosinicella sp.]
MNEGPQQTLGARHVVAVAVGIVVGAGIFRTPSLVAGAAGSEAAFLALWVAGGLLSIVGALCYAELASAFPSAGGDYHFLGRAFGRRLGFLYAWARLAIIQTGSIALLAFVFGDYASEILPLGPASSSLYAAAAVGGLTLLNWAHVRQGTGGQLLLTAVEVGGLIALAALGLLAAGTSGATAPPPAGGTGSIGLALVFVLLTFGGWSETAYLSAELRDGRRRIAAVLVGSLGFVTLLYLLVNLAYLRTIGLGGIAASDAVAADLVAQFAGPAGVAAISLLVAVAALTSANATIITGARTTYELGRNFRQLRWLGRWSSARGTPRNALLFQGAVALLLIAAGGFARDGFHLAVEYTAPAFWLFMLLVGIAFFVLRAREPEAPRPFRVPFYPFLPLLFCATSAFLLYSSLAYTGLGALAGAGILVAGALMLPFLSPTPDEEKTK